MEKYADMIIPVDDRKILKDLANKVAELSCRSIESANSKLWLAHNDLKTTQPVVFCDPENGWNEIILQSDLKCTKKISRDWEFALRKEIFWGQTMGDNRVTNNVIEVPYIYKDTGWGLEKTIIESDVKDGAITWETPMKSYDMMDQMRFPEYVMDHDGSKDMLNLAGDIFSDVLDVKQRQMWWWSLGMTWQYIDIRGLEKLMFDMFDYPDEVHALMEFLMKGWQKRIDYLEDAKLLSSNNGNKYVGSGGFGFTDDLPKDNDLPVTTMDMWGFAESQETVGVSPNMFEEFIFPYQLKLMERFGLNCYGCCEPVDKRWDILKQIPRLRRISVSPWADVQKMADYLGKDYVYSWKPNPAYLAVANPDWDNVRNQLRTTIDAAKDGCLEIIMKDNHTIANNPNNVIRWCEIANEEINR